MLDRRPMLDVREIGHGLGFLEGPVVRSGGELVVVSLNLGVVFSLTDVGTNVLATIGGGPNGCIEGGDGSLYIAQNGGHCPGESRRPSSGGVQVLHPNGTVEWLTQDPIAPNDLCFGPDGFIYCTDPTRQVGLDDGRIWRIHPTTGEAQLLCSVPWFPNGIGFELRSDVLFVASTRDRRIMAFPFADGQLGPPEIFADVELGGPDGFAFDTAGNLLVASVGNESDAGCIAALDDSGRIIDVLDSGASRYITNIAISPGGTIFVTDSERGVVLVSDDWLHPGLLLHPFRPLGKV